MGGSSGRGRGASVCQVGSVSRAVRCGNGKRVCDAMRCDSMRCVWLVASCCCPKCAGAMPCLAKPVPQKILSFSTRSGDNVRSEKMMFTAKWGCNPICAWGSSKCCRREVGFDQDEMRAGGSTSRPALLLLHWSDWTELETAPRS